MKSDRCVVAKIAIRCRWDPKGSGRRLRADERMNTASVRLRRVGMRGYPWAARTHMGSINVVPWYGNGGREAGISAVEISRLEELSR